MITEEQVLDQRQAKQLAVKIDNQWVYLWAGTNSKRPTQANVLLQTQWLLQSALRTIEIDIENISMFGEKPQLPTN